MILENAIFSKGGHPVVVPPQKQLKYLTTTKLPRFVKTFLVVMTALPFAHWFMDEYIQHDIYTDFAVAMFRVVKL